MEYPDKIYFDPMSWHGSQDGAKYDVYEKKPKDRPYVSIYYSASEVRKKVNKAKKTIRAAIHEAEIARLREALIEIRDRARSCAPMDAMSTPEQMAMKLVKFSRIVNEALEDGR